jgi:hypothetical protein
MKRPSQRPRELHLQPNARRQPDETTAVARDKGMSRWRALERDQFEALTASPIPDGGPEGGSKSC